MGPSELLAWIHGLRSAFGDRLLLCLAISMGALKGFLGGGGSAGLVGVPIDFMLREFGVDASSMQVYRSAVLIPWSIKPLMGLVSDSLPVWGFHRLPYFAAVAVPAFVSYVIIPFGPGLSLHLLLSLLFFIFLQIAMSDLLSEAVYSTRLREMPEHGPDLISFVWGSIGVGKLVSTSIVGVVIASFGSRMPYAVGIPFAALALFIPLFNLIEEKPSPDSRRCASRAESDLPLAVVAIITGLGALGLSLLSILGASLQVKISAAACLAVLVLFLFSVVLAPVIAKINAFFFIHAACAFSIDGASFYFFTDGADEYPEGPHFSTVFYTSVLGLVSTVFSLIGMFVYTRWMKHWKYQRVLVVGNVLAAAVQLLSCVVYLRWNVRIGVDDRFFVLASSAVQTVVFELAWLPGMLIISQLCPAGKEATMFALLAGSGNLGMNLGGYFGAFLLHLLGVAPNGSAAESAQFDKLWIAALIAGMAPCLPLLLIRVLVPDVSQTEKIEGLEDATEGSLLVQFCGHPAKQRAVPHEQELQHMVGCSDDQAESSAAQGRQPP